MSLTEVVQHRILDDMIKSVVGDRTDDNQWKVLVVDHIALRIIGASTRMFDITDAGITLVENLTQKRQPLRNFEAIYFVAPVEDSISRIVQDFERGKVRYKSAHIFTTSPTPDYLFKKLTTPDMVKYIRGFTELNVDFLTVESNVFSLDQPMEFYSQYSPLSDNKESLGDRIAEQLATVCVTLGENPYICYVNNDSRTKRLADTLQAKIDQYVEGGELSERQADRGQLLIVDRSSDVISPLLHELTYQAMAYDLLPITDDIYKYKGNGNVEKMAILGCNDSVWMAVRHQHIANTISHLKSSFKEFREQSKAVKEGQGNNVRDLQAILKAAPQLAEQTAKFELHFDLTARLQRIEDETNLDEMCIAEQNMVMGSDGDGQKKNPLLHIIQLLQSNKVPQNNKIRMLALYVIIKQKGITSSDLDKLFSQAMIVPSFTSNGNAIGNMDLLGVTVDSDHSIPSAPIKRKTRDLSETYTTSRWTPTLKDLIENLTEGVTDNKLINFVRSAPPKKGSAPMVAAPVSARTKPGWAKKGGEKGTKEEKGEKHSGPRVIVYLIGGMTMSEMRVATEVMKASNRQIII
eukprot:Ihof_evm1s153 gene=Ihof_evmTU1s153